MTYPLSSDVSSGQPTAAAQYNNLRADALRLGQPAADSVLVGQLLEAYSSRLTLEALDSNRLRVPASAQEPVCLMIDGCAVRAEANVDLAPGAAPGGTPAVYYIFAVRGAGSSSFTLSVNTSATPWSGARQIGACYWNGSRIVPESIQLSSRARQIAELKYCPAQSACGRLTLQSGEAFSTSDRSGANLYFTPFQGNVIDLYVPGIGWAAKSFNELSLSFASAADDRNYDIFLYQDAGGALALEAVAWSSDTIRSEALTTLDGIDLKAGNTGCRYLGTVRTDSGGQLQDTARQRFVWNALNRQRKPLGCQEANLHTYQAAAWRVWNNNPLNCVEMAAGKARVQSFQLFGELLTGGSNIPAYIGMGLNQLSSDVMLGVREPDVLNGSVCFDGALREGLNTLYVTQYSHASYAASYYKFILNGSFSC